LLVTRPPIKSNGNVAQARITASRWGQTLGSPGLVAGPVPTNIDVL
jgi:hypothetical protein